MDGITALLQIVGLLANVLIMLVIIQFVIGLLFAFNVVNQSNQFLIDTINNNFRRCRAGNLDCIRYTHQDRMGKSDIE